MLPLLFTDYLTVNNSIHSHNTRITNDLYLTTVSSNYGQRCLAYRGSRFWNKLPAELKLSMSV